MSIASTASILFAIKSMVQKDNGQQELPAKVPPSGFSDARDAFFENHLLSLDTEEAKLELNQLNELSTLLANR